MNDEFIYTTAIRKLRTLTKRIKVIPGGTSGGKTYGILPILIDKAARQKNLEISIVSESIPHLRRGAMKDFEKIMKSTNRWIQDHFSKTLLKYTFASGSYIEFFGADQADKLRGARRHILYINEANNVNFDAYQQLSIRTSQEVWIDFNPTNEFWAHTELANDTDAEWMTLTYKDNEALSDSIVKEIEKAKEKAKTSSYWENWWKVYGLGQLGVLEGVVFDNWRVIDKIPEAAKLLGYGMDFGYTNDPTTLIAVYSLDGQLLLDELIYETGMTNKDISNRLKILGVTRSESIFADSSEPKSIAEIKASGFSIKGATKGKDSIIFGIGILQDYKMQVTSRSTNLINELRRYAYDKDKAGASLNKPIDQYNHAIDAIRYFAVEKLAKSSNKSLRFASTQTFKNY